MANKFQVCKHCEDSDCMNHENPCVGCFWHDDMPFPVNYCEPATTKQTEAESPQNKDMAPQNKGSIPQKIAVNDCTGGRSISVSGIESDTSVILQHNFNDSILFTGFKYIESCKEIIESGYSLVAVFKRVNRK